MGCSFSSPQLAGAPGADGVVTYSINHSGLQAADNFGVVGSFGIPIAGKTIMCGEAGSAVALLQVPGTRITCNTVTISQTISVECPIKKTDIPAGTATLEFSMIPITSGGVHIQNGLPGPPAFVILGNPTATITSTTCTPAATGWPSGCNTDNCLRALQHTPMPASSFCSAYLRAHATSTPSFISHGCAGSPVHISSACKCLTASNARRTLVRAVRAPASEEKNEALDERDAGYSGPDHTIAIAPPAAKTVTSILTVQGSPTCGPTHA